VLLFREKRTKKHLAFALRAWLRDRVRLGGIRQGCGWTALALTAGADLLLAASFVRIAVVYPPPVPYPAILHDWAFAAVVAWSFSFFTLAAFSMY